MTTTAEMINRLRATPTIMAIELRKAMTASLTLIEKDARQYAPRDQGRLGGGITSTIEGSGLTLVGRVGPSVTYGAPVEFGRRAGAQMPPVAALIPWVERHWRAPLVGSQRLLGGEFLGETGYRATNKRRPSARVSQSAIRRRAFALAIAIGRRGIRRRPYLGEAYNKNRQEISYRFGRVGQAIAVSIGTGSESAAL